jgi:Na+/H+ antiporter NhaD/arsenite permease-like protein
MDDATKALIVLGLVVALFMWNKLPVGGVAILAALTLWATGLVTAEQAVAGFGDPVVVFIATLFVVSEGIDSTGSPPGRAAG